jgi:hypothetical protein
MNRTRRTSPEEQDSIEKTVRTIQAGQDSEDRTTRKGIQDNTTPRKEQPRQDGHHGTVRNRQPGRGVGI